MEIIISDDKSILAIQKRFSEQFAYLKLEFFNRPHITGAGSNINSMLNANKTIGECRSVHNTGTVIIKPGMTVADLEEQFQTKFGLSAQVFRKSGKVWLETTMTDGWTLEEQNRQGEELSSSRK